MHDLAFSEAAPSCEWTDASRKFELHIDPDVIAPLGAVPRHGLETSGVLLGRAEPGRNGTTFWVEGFRPVDSDQRLREEIRRNGSACLGIYRCEMRLEKLQSDRQDVKAFERCFEAGSAVFLMIVPGLHKAAVFTRVTRKLKCIGEFALPGLFLRLPGRGGPIRSRRSRPITPPEREIPELAPPPKTGFANKFALKFGIAAAALGLLFLGAAGSNFAPSLRPYLPKEAASASFVDLKVQPVGSSLLLTWFPNSSALRNSTRVILHIQDGAYRSDRELTASEFHKGSLAYAAKNGQVIFRMDAYSAQPNATGTIQVISAHPAPAAPHTH